MNNKTVENLQSKLDNFRFVNLMKVEETNYEHLFNPPKLELENEESHHKFNRKRWQLMIDEIKEYQTKILELQKKQNKIKKELFKLMQVYEW